MNIIDQIRAKNEDFVKNENFSGLKKLVVDNYNDSAHFVFELLQNADDAKATEIKFTLSKNQLEVTHNGIKFNENDVKAICSISMGTKSDDYTKIGRFGIGFKSVFAYTNKPEVHSGNYHFEIEELILPKNISKIDNQLDTLFKITFDNPKVKYKAYSQIRKKFEDMAEESILFLSYIKKIELIDADDDYTKTILKNITLPQELKDDSRYFESTISIEDTEYESTKYKFLMAKKEKITLYEKDDNDKKKAIKNQSVSIAYQLNSSQRSQSLVNLNDYDDNYYFVFFPTMIANNYPFLIHAPFITKFSRDTFAMNDETNETLKKQIGILIANSLIALSSKNLINGDIINEFFFSYKTDKTIEDSFKEELTNLIKTGYKIIPTYKNGLESIHKVVFTITDNDNAQTIKALMGDNWIKKHYNCEDIYSFGPICSYENHFYEYILNVFNPNILSIDSLLPSLTKSFMESKESKWLVRLINLFIYEEKTRYGDEFKLRTNADLREYPLVKTINNEYLNYRECEEKHIYLNNGTLNEMLLSNNCVEYLYKNIFKLQEYSDYLNDAKAAIQHIENRDFSKSEYTSLLKKIILAIQSKKLSINEIKDKCLIQCENQLTHSIDYFKPEDSIMGLLDNEKINLYTIFKNIDTYLIKQDVIDSIGCTDLSVLGCKNNIKTAETSPYLLLRENSIIDYWSYQYKNVYIKPANKEKRDFDPLTYSPELIGSIESKMTLEKSIEIIKLLKFTNMAISGRILYSSTQDFKSTGSLYGEKKIYTLLGEAIKDNKWIYDSNGKPKKPEEISLKDLNKKYESYITVDLANKLSFKESVDDTIEKYTKELNKKGISGHFVSDEDYELLEQFKRNKQKEIEKEQKRKSVKEKLNDINSHVPDSEAKDNEIPDDPDAIHNKAKRENELKKEFEENENKEAKERRILSKRNVNKEEKVFLMHQYKGICQICGEKIITKNGDYLFHATNLITTSKLKKEGRKSENLGWNSLCLCPNCSAKYTRCDNNFSGFIDLVKEAEIVEGHRETIDFPITLNGKNRMISYTPKHLQTLQIAIEYYENQDQDIENILEEDLNELPKNSNSNK